MLVDFRPHARLRGERPLNFATTVAPVIEALCEDTVDLSRVRMVCDWVQYRESFRGIVDMRPILSRAESQTGVDPISVPVGDREDEVEIAVDVRRGSDADLKGLTSAGLRDGVEGRVFLEDWGMGSTSCIWDFNALYWSSLDVWEKSTGRGYEQALPGGESDARNREAASELVGELFTIWDLLADKASLPDELYVVELGVGNGGQAKVFLDEFRSLDHAHGRDYYRRLHYLMCDYSQHVLNLARETVADHAERVSSFVLDATRPRISLGFLQYKVFLVYISNVYDNLPTDEVAHLASRTYRVQTRAYLLGREAEELARSVSATTAELPGLVHKLLRLGPSLLAEAVPAHIRDVDAAAKFWQRTWSSLHLAER